MANSNHTQGGWNRNIMPVSKYPIIFAGRNTHVAKVITAGIPEDEAEANARLIAAAPDLLDALRQIEALNMRGIAMSARIVHCSAIARAAIAKATS